MIISAAPICLCINVPMTMALVQRQRSSPIWVCVRCRNFCDVERPDYGVLNAATEAEIEAERSAQDGMLFWKLPDDVREGLDAVREAMTE